MSTWAELHRLLAVADDGSVALATQIGFEPARNAASFQSVVFVGGERPIVIAEAEIAAPADRWEIRASGLWADHVCETPLAHWSYGLEAFGLAIDRPDELLGRGYGDRVAIGWEVEFEADPADAHAGTGPMNAERGVYGQPGRLDGLVLIGTTGRSVPISGPAVRHHRWGEGVPADADATLGAIDDGGGVVVALPLPMSGAVWWVENAGTGLRTTTTGPGDPGLSR